MRRTWGARCSILALGVSFARLATAQPGAVPPKTGDEPPAEAEPAPEPQPEPPPPATPARPAPAAEGTHERAPDGPKAQMPVKLPTPHLGAPDANAPYPRSSFSFGSYGRVVVASDGRGGEGRNADVVAYGSRIDESTYAELEMRRDDQWDAEVSSRVVTTLALAGPLFHYDGRFDAQIAVRNLFIEERGIGDKGISAWIGSRMYRGDDIYLLDFWPLDNLNTVGGGVRFDFPDKRSYIAWHVGLNRAADRFQYQVVQRPAAQNQPGTTDVALFDRPRVISSLKLSHTEPLFDGRGGIKGILYGEVHRLPSGDRETQPGRLETVPGDSGALIGGQIGLYTGEHDTFVNLFVRHSTGLAAYGELATPEGTSPQRTVEGAKQTLIGLAGNYENDLFGVVVGGYFRSFREPTPEPYTYGNVDEGILVARPHLFLGDHAGLAVEGSYQAQERGILNIATNRPLYAKVWRFGVMPYLSPAGKGVFKRPQMRLIWAVTQRNDDARALYPLDDAFARRKVEQFFGIGAEWWFNSTSYGN